jgi:hypothetical protein
MTTKIGAVLNKITIIANTIIEINYPDECSISRPSTTIGDYGTGTATYSTVSGMTGIGCSWEAVSETSAQEYIRAGQVNEVCTYKVTMASAINGAAINIKPKDRVVIATRGIEPQRTFEVKGIIRNAGLPLLVLCTLEEA